MSLSLGRAGTGSRCRYVSCSCAADWRRGVSRAGGGGAIFGNGNGWEGFFFFVAGIQDKEKSSLA
jgi:hypothetical protein